MRRAFTFVLAVCAACADAEEANSGIADAHVHLSAGQAGLSEAEARSAGSAEALLKWLNN